jgi:hypothetical protein
MRIILVILFLSVILFSCRTKKAIVEEDNSTVTRTEVIDTLVTIDSSVVKISVPVNMPDTTITFETPEQVVTVQKKDGQFNVRAVSKQRTVPVRKKVTIVEERDTVYKQRESFQSDAITSMPKVFVIGILILLLIIFIINKLLRA